MEYTLMMINMNSIDYTPCLRHTDGTLVNPEAYRRWCAERKKKHQLETLKAMGWSENEIEMK